MASYEEQFLSKVIDENAISVITRYRIEESDMPTAAGRNALRFVMDYAKQNGGQAPSYATFAAENPDVTYIPDVTDSFDYMAKQMKSFSAKMKIKQLIEKELPTIFSDKDGITTAELLKEKFEQIIIGTNVRNKIGTDVKQDTDNFLREYQNRKEGKSFRIWKSKFPTINAELGGYLSGNMYTWFGRSGRGKSVFVMEEALESAMQGANVLVWSMEMSWFQWMARAYSSLSARDNLVQAEINGQVFAAGFENKAMLQGNLPPEFEEGLRSFLASINEKIAGNIILRAVDDDNFDDRSLKALEADLIATKADVAVIDPFYYLDYEKNTSKTTGGDAAATSIKLRRLTGKYDVVMHVITQADEIKDEKDDDGCRELSPPQRSEIKKTKQVLEDGAGVMGIDSIAREGRGMISIGKGRDGGEDTEVEIVYLPNYGIVREPDTIESSSNFSAILSS